jgi:acyl dehydratase
VGDYVQRAAALEADVHIDSAVAVELGLDGPILPGTCVLGIVARVLAPHRASPGRLAAGPTFRGLSARYLGVAYPGRDLTISVWLGEGKVASYAVFDDGRPVLTGQAEYA